jgi:hypothetical protein
VNRWRALCADCQALVAHPLEKMAFSAGDLVAATLKVWAENALWVLPLAIAGALPIVAVRGWGPRDKWWIETACSMLFATLIECLLLLRAARRTFSWSNRATLPTVASRYGAVVVVNVLSQLATTVGFLGCLVGALFVANFFNLAVPLALFEKQAPWTAVRRSVVMSFAQYGRLLPASLLFGGLAMAASLTLTWGPQLAARVPRYAALAEAVRILAPIIERMVNTLPQMLELTAWYFVVLAGAQTTSSPAPPSGPPPSPIV